MWCYKKQMFFQRRDLPEPAGRVSAGSSTLIHIEVRTLNARRMFREFRPHYTRRDPRHPFPSHQMNEVTVVANCYIRASAADLQDRATGSDA